MFDEFDHIQGTGKSTMPPTAKTVLMVNEDILHVMFLQYVEQILQSRTKKLSAIYSDENFDGKNEQLLHEESEVVECGTTGYTDEERLECGHAIDANDKGIHGRLAVGNEELQTEVRCILGGLEVGEDCRPHGD